MTPGGSSGEALVVGSAFLTDLGSLFPVRLKLVGEELEFVFVLPDDRTGGRASRSETTDHPFIELKERIRLRFGAGTVGPVPRFFVDAGGRWARLRVELAGTAVRAVIVMPEEVTAESLNAPFLGRWQEHIPSTVKLAVDEIARMLSRCRHRAGGTEPLIDLELGYLPDPGYQARFARAHEPVRAFVAPIRPVLRMRWISMTSAQRRVFLDELTNVGTIGRWPRRRLTTRIMGLEVELPHWAAPKVRAVPGPQARG
ncbi:hypothetical protein [Amycolatopsis orientalis]|uniref:hypothetical protein n=1 Tax=Amycolatopsis orientalis TaxID=31958 RepID=UPI0004258B8E|nr:hypothetical protein [Amycolatopsis orientalis]